MTKKEYVDYKAAVDAFFERNGIENLSSGRITCECCHEKLNFDNNYPTCKNEECHAFDEPLFSEPFFSWNECECCGTHLGGNRVDASGYNREKDEAYEFVVCEDCIYFAEYGQLDDQTMMEIEADVQS